MIDRGWAVRQLKRDKHTLLEGYVTEFLFKRQFLAGMGDNYSHGWWMGMLGEQRHFFLLKDEPSALDREIMERLSGKYICWRAAFSRGLWNFYQDSKVFTQKEFIRTWGLKKPKRKSVCATDDTRNEDRQNQCIAFFEEKDMLAQVAVERNFADDFLSVYFNGIVNIDYFTKNKAGELCVLELKFKNESQEGMFGIDVGEVSMLTDLRDLGFRLIHAVLYKERELGEYLSIFRYLELTGVERSWYIHDLKIEELEPEVGDAPGQTSLDGKKIQRYRKLKKDKVLRPEYRHPLVLS